jgi:hypothetical protein
MRQKNQFTNAEKVAIFDALHDETKDEFNESAVEEDRDEHYFWETVMERVLDLKGNDWSLHNNGHQF